MIQACRSTRAARLLLSTALVAPLAVVAGEAAAGGFGLREQSAYYQGTSFAGNAAGGAGLASMYWNPAAISFVPGMQFEGNVTYIAPNASIDVLSSRSALGTNMGTYGVDNIVDSGVLPTGYATYAGDRWAVGLSLNSPYGLVTDATCNWSGRNYGCYSRIFDINLGAQVAYKVNDWLTVGGGVNANYFDAKLTNAQLLSAAPPFPTGNAVVNGDDIGYGFSLGALVTVMPGTTIGIGYRSAISNTLEGLTNLSTVSGTTLANLSTTAGLTLPDQITGSFRSQITPQWTLSGTVEWTNWSNLESLVIDSSTATPSVLNLQWQDGWFFSGGVEYQWTPQLAVRAGLAYEISPVTDAYRTPRLPDSDRIWASAGFTYAWTPNLSLDFAYTHIFGQSGNITLFPNELGNATRGSLVAEVNDAYVDIVSVGVRYRFDTAQPKTVLVTK
ncbi:MAG: outer membrane protein transport protein [Pseudomonadota bacterium]